MLAHARTATAKARSDAAKYRRRGNMAARLAAMVKASAKKKMSYRG
jgi:hypothetical protein